MQFHPKHARKMNGMTSVAFCASPVKSCGVQIIISLSITNIPSSSLKLSEVSRVLLIKFCFPQISWSHLCHIVSNCLWCPHACVRSHIRTSRLCLCTNNQSHTEQERMEIHSQHKRLCTKSPYCMYMCCSLQMFRCRQDTSVCTHVRTCAHSYAAWSVDSQ